MPNWCYNKIEFSGPKKIIKRIMREAKGPHAHYNDVHHEPQWEVFEDIRLKSLFAHPAESNGPIHDFCFHSLVPIPEEYRRFPYDNGRADKARALVGAQPDLGGYSKQIELWGTKWDIEATPEIIKEWTDNGNKYMSFIIQCDTAWSPPMEFLENVTDKYKDVEVEINYEEPGMGVAGTSRFKNGECIYDEERECICHECDLPLDKCGGGPCEY